MSKKFEDEVLQEINKFRKVPTSVQEKLNLFKLSLSRLKVAADFEKDVGNFIPTLSKIKPCPPLERNSDLDNKAKDFLNKFVNEEDETQYFPTTKLKGLVNDKLLDQNCCVVISDGAETPNDVVTQVLINKLDKERVGRKCLSSGDYALIGLAHTERDDENVIAIVFAEEPKFLKIDSNSFSAQVLEEINKFRKTPKILLKLLQKAKEDAVKAKKSEKYIKDLDSMMRELAKSNSLPKIDRDPELDKAAETELKNAINDEDYDEFQNGSEVPSVPKKYDESVVICDTGADDPMGILPKILSNRADKNKIARKMLNDPETTKVGIAHSSNNNQNKVILVLAKEPVEEDTKVDLPKDADLSEFKKAFDYYDYNKKGIINVKRIVDNMKNNGYDKVNPEIYKMMKELSKEHEKCRFPTFVKFIIDYISDNESDEGLKKIFNVFLKNGEKTINALEFREMINSLGPKEKDALEEIDKFIINKYQSQAKLTLNDFLEYMKS